MNENAKLMRAKKFIKVSEILLKIASIMAIVGVAILLTGSIVLLANQASFNKMFAEAEGTLSVDGNIGSVRLVLAEMPGSYILDVFESGDLESDVPFIQDWIANENYAGIMGMMLMAYIPVVAMVAVGFIFLRLIFTKMRKEDTPFSYAVIKQMRVSFIVISVVLALTTGSLGAAGIILGMWCLYFIFEYGYCLQELADETI